MGRLYRAPRARRRRRCARRRAPSGRTLRAARQALGPDRTRAAEERVEQVVEAERTGVDDLKKLVAVLIQADRFGDLDHETRQLLDRTGAKEPGMAMSARLISFDQKRTELTPGTVLVREWDRKSQRVMVMSDGFAWNGQTYDSLSKVAFAITGTRWNGPRFFGLRDKEDRSATEARS